MYIICNSIPTGTELQFSITLASVERSRPGLIISGDRSKGQDKNLFRTKTTLVPRIYPAGFKILYTCDTLYIKLYELFLNNSCLKTCFSHIIAPEAGVGRNTCRGC